MDLVKKHQDEFQANKELWNSRVEGHQDTELYNLDAFKKGKTSLNKVELTELGSVKGKSLLHLQCHFGQDSLSWVREGAKVTAMDISDEAIKKARELNEELELDAEFVVSNLYDLPDNLKGQFDVVFTSYGTIGWLPNMTEWAKVVNHFLKPGGTFYMVEFHPVVWMFDDNFESLVMPYNNSGVLAFESNSSYASPEIKTEAKMEYSWNHGIGEVVSALASTGLQLDFLNEHDYSPYNVFPHMIEGEKGWQIDGYEGIIPMMYSMKWKKS
jgi:ubiquinone/menaquinone biosynthesis C-methylase UbiE